MIVWAGNLHAQIVQQLLGDWSNDQHTVKFLLTGIVGNEFLTITVDSLEPEKCMLDFSLRGEVTITCLSGRKYPIEAMIDMDGVPELRLWINRSVVRLQKRTS